MTLQKPKAFDTEAAKDTEGNLCGIVFGGRTGSAEKFHKFIKIVDITVKNHAGAFW
jgi:hypothetical protein